MTTVSPVYICVGQCGIQLGQHVVENMQTNAKDNNTLNRSLIFVDSEKKVVTRACQTLGENSGGRIDEKNVITIRGGCGNNWGLGYLMGKEPFMIDGTFSSYCTVGERVMDSVRRSVERIDSHIMTMLFHSTGGGTGAGLGSHLLELHKEHYPKAYLHSVTVLPHSAGDTPLQNYNSLFTLTTIQECADSCLLLSNDEGIGLHKSSVSIATRCQSYTIEEVNARFTRNILGLYSPAVSLSDSNQTSQLQNLLSYLSPDNYHKFFTIHQVSSTTATPAYLLKQVIIQKLNTDYAKDKILNTHSAVLVTRGMKDRDSMHAYTEVKDKITHLLYPASTNSIIDILHCDGSFPCNERSSVTLGLNSSLEKEFFQRVVTNSSLLLSQRAYLHWYHKYGVTDEKFKQSIESLSELIAHY
ncbi:Tubulin beta-8 chain isoform A [Oopsacas minuta]|uniref:Tubulin beta-8 chain isoform A n=1 Tax=Oopsacas minuta TaxID=111878 RepID=A0AAV7K205_9METZ|nr:Tubulin beta-8 chain isoform A [Oopsacas minuta]